MIIIPKIWDDITTKLHQEGSTHKSSIDFFNIRWFNNIDINNDDIKWRNLVNKSDEKMVDLQEYMIYSHLQDILWIPLQYKSFHIKEYTRFEWDPGFWFNNNITKRLFDDLGYHQIPWAIFPNWSTANWYIINYMKSINNNKTIAISKDSHSSIKNQKGVSLIKDSEVQDIIKTLNDIKAWGIIATFGTTNYWTDDDRIMSKDILDYCEDKNILIHLDMAYAWYYLSDQKKERLKNNYEYINSIMIDPHKLICDIWCSLLLFPNRSNHESSEVDYFHWLWTIAGTSLSPRAAYQAREFLNKYWLQWLNTLKKECLNKAKKIAKWFEEAWYELFVSSEEMQYPNVCVKVEQEWQSYIVEIFERKWFQIATIKDWENSWIRIFVSPTDEFNNNIIDFLEIIQSIPKETFIRLEE